MSSADVKRVLESPTPAPASLEVVAAHCKLAAIRCKFCEAPIPIEDEGAIAWEICEECWPDVCYESDL